MVVARHHCRRDMTVRLSSFHAISRATRPARFSAEAIRVAISIPVNRRSVLHYFLGIKQ